jgi:hypothetical protein
MNSQISFTACKIMGLGGSKGVFMKKYFISVRKEYSHLFYSFFATDSQIDL